MQRKHGQSPEHLVESEWTEPDQTTTPQRGSDMQHLRQSRVIRQLSASPQQLS
jgi:hypothetical protein